MTLTRRLLPPLRRCMSTSAPLSRVPVIHSLDDLRSWRRQARDDGRSVGIVPTMGALHAGHLNLVRQSLRANPLTVLTLFVNPTQFAPHEDLASYPRTLPQDVAKLEGLLEREPTASAGDAPEPLIVFAPGREVMYPLSLLRDSEGGELGEGMLQDTSKQRGAFVEVKGWGEVMEGRSRPQFFRGVATVCAKLFNAVEPDHAYFGQKDIQQALLLKIMLRDLLMAYPTSDNFHIIPTTRDPADSLALSSRNVYLSASERRHATALIAALTTAQNMLPSPSATGAGLVGAAEQVIAERTEQAQDDGVDMRLDYFEVFDKTSFVPIRGALAGREAVICGAVWVGKTRLIDNVLLGWEV